GPGALFAGVDLEITGAVVTARQTVADAAYGKLLFARTHEGVAGPFAAAVVVDRVDVIIARDQRAAQQSFASARRHVPPAFGGPALGILVAERDADPAAGIVAEPEVGPGRRRRQQQQHRHDRGGDNAAPDGDRRQAGHDSYYYRVARLSRDGSSPVNDDGAEVVHIGEGRAGNQQVAQRAEKARGIVVGEKRGRIEAARFGAGDRVAVDDGTGGVGGAAGAAVGAVGVGGDGADA